MSGYIERQKIGVTRDRVTQFCERREEAQKKRRDITKRNLKEIAQLYIETPNSPPSPSSFVKSIQFPTANIFGRQASSPNILSSTPDDHCLVCGKSFGLLNKKVHCNMCKKGYCAKCLKRISKNEISVIQQSELEVIMCCPQCLVVLMSIENHTKVSKRLNQSRERDALLPCLYDQMRACQITIDSMMPKYEYLVFSICDTSNSSSNNASTFQQIYEHVMQMQIDIGNIFHKYESLLRDFSALPTPTPTSEKLKVNTKIGFLEFLQTQLPKFKGLQKQVLKIELNTATNVYFVLARAAIDSRGNSAFWSKYGKPFGDTIHIVKADMQRAALQAGENWEKHKSTAEDLVCSWEPKEKGHSILGLGVPASQEFEGTLLRKNIEALRGALKQMENKVGANSLRATKEATTNLVQMMQNSYNQQLRV